MMKINILLTAVLTLFTVSAHAQDVDSYKEQVLQDVQKLQKNDIIISKIKERNSAHADLTQADIDKLDSAWRAEIKDDNFNVIKALLNSDASKELVKVKDASEGVYGEIFIMDNKGLNVAISDITSDYWQGDEAKWKQTYLDGKDTLHMSDVEFDESVQAFTVQISAPLLDESGNPIGAVTFGIVME